MDSYDDVPRPGSETGPAGPESPPWWAPRAAAADDTVNDDTASEAAVRPHRRAGRGRRQAALLAAVALVAGGAGALIAETVGTGSAAASPSGVRVVGATGTAVSGNWVKTAIARAEPSVVIINDDLTSSGVVGGFGFGFSQPQTEKAAGTGLVLTAGGEIVTNAHVVNGASNIQVTIPGHGTHSASIVGLNATEDLAVLRVSGVSGLTPATFAQSTNVSVGDSVLAIGNAEGYGGTPTVTAGIVSALGRTLTTDTDDIHGVIQTDAPINSGDSGGPLLNTAGEVIGIDTAVATPTSSDDTAQDIGFAIPSSTVLAELGALQAGHSSGANPSASAPSAGTAFLGVEVESADGGALVGAVDPGSGAAHAGLQPGEVITALDGKPVTGAASLQQLVRAHRAGQTVTLSVRTSGGSTTTVTATLGRAPAGY